MKKEKNDRTKICIVDSVYSLLIYLLLMNEEEFGNTYFFFVSPMPKDVSLNFKRSFYFDWPKSVWRGNLKAFYYRFVKYLKYPFLSHSDFYGLDNLQLTSALLGNNSIKVLEDGLLNYLTRKKRSNRFLKSLFLGSLRNGDPYGYSASVSNIYLTGLAPVPKELQDKVILVDLKDRWRKKSDEYKKTILKLYNLTEELICEFKEVNSILFTQPLYEDGTLSEEEKVLVYKTIIDNKKIAIKPHPKENTDYHHFFPNALILRNSVPMELLFLIGVNFTDVYTLFSTVVLTYKDISNIHFLGTRVHPKILKRFGDIIYEDGRVRRTNIH